MFSYYRKQLFGEGGNEHFHQLIYMTAHAILSFLSFIIAYYCWFNFYFHTLYLIIVLHVAIWNGARFYFKVAMNKDRIIKIYEKEKAAAILASSSFDNDNVNIQKNE